MKNSNFAGKAHLAIDELVDLTEAGIKEYDIVFEENFPAISYKIIEVDGQKYKMKVEISVQKIPN